MGGPVYTVRGDPDGPAIPVDIGENVTVELGSNVEITNDVGNPIPVSLPAAESHLGEVGGRLAAVAASELTRPSDTTAYAALDVISNSTSAPVVLTFTNLARITGGSGYIVKARVMTDQKVVVARFRLHLFHTAPTAINDNSPYLLLYANRANRIGQVDFSAAGTEDATNSTAASALAKDERLAFVCATGDRNVYGILETLDAFTPASGQKFYVELTADLN